MTALFYSHSLELGFLGLGIHLRVGKSEVNSNTAL